MSKFRTEPPKTRSSSRNDRSKRRSSASPEGSVQRLADVSGLTELRALANASAGVQRLLAIQSLANGGGKHPHAIRAEARAGVQGQGQPLPHLERIQASFGDRDLSGVRAYTGPRAAAASEKIGASAYATGDRVAFRRRAPDLQEAAHEAAHVVQQRAGLRPPGGVGRVGDRYEQHADQVAEAVTAGRSAQPILARLVEPRAAGGAAARAEVGGAVQLTRDEAMIYVQEVHRDYELDEEHAQALIDAIHLYNTDTFTIDRFFSDKLPKLMADNDTLLTRPPPNFINTLYNYWNDDGKPYIGQRDPYQLSQTIPKFERARSEVILTCRDLRENDVKERFKNMLTRTVTYLRRNGIHIEHKDTGIPPIKCLTRSIAKLMNRSNIGEIKDMIRGSIYFNTRDLAMQAFSLLTKEVPGDKDLARIWPGTDKDRFSDSGALSFGKFVYQLWIHPEQGDPYWVPAEVQLHAKSYAAVKNTEHVLYELISWVCAEDGLNYDTSADLGKIIAIKSIVDTYVEIIYRKYAKGRVYGGNSPNEEHAPINKHEGDSVIKLVSDALLEANRIIISQIDEDKDLSKDLRTRALESKVRALEREAKKGIHYFN